MKWLEIYAVVDNAHGIILRMAFYLHLEFVESCFNLYKTQSHNSLPSPTLSKIHSLQKYIRS